MSRNIWVTSDHHFGHAKILTFTDEDHQLIRPGFCNVEEMDEFMITRYNDNVGDYDKVYFLGDLGFGHDEERFRSVMRRLKGKKRLILGNHDALDVNVYREFFDSIIGSRVGHDLPGNKPFVMTHFPISDNSLGYGHRYNVHGHTHQRNVHMEVWSDAAGGMVEIEDQRYINVSVEQTDYYPVHIDELVARMP